MYFYSIEGKNHIRAIIHAIEIIMTSQLYFQNEIGFDKNLLGHYSNTKYDFLNKFLYIIFQNAQKKLENPNYIRLIFRIFKYVYFLFKYVKEEDVVNEQFEKLQRRRTRRDKEKEKSKEKEKDETEGEKTETEKKKKSIEISISLIRLITNKANAFLDKNDIDQAVFEYYKNNDEFGKLFALMFVMDEKGILQSFSKYFADRMEEFRQKKFIFDINGTVQDYSTEESQSRLREYVKTSEIKYYALIEGAYNYCLNLKSIKIDDKRDNSKITEENENEESDGDDGKSSVDNNKNEKNNKADLNDEISEEEEEVNDKNEKKKDKILEDEKEEEEEDGDDNRDGEDNDDGEEDDEESKNQKNKGKNKIDSKKRKADELKPKQKKSQTYKNKKK